MAKILLADDSAFMRKVLSDILIKNDYKELIEAENGQQAVDKFNSDHPDLVMLDVIMPEKDGIAVLKEIGPKGAKVLIISAVGQNEMIDQAKSAGALGYIVKPFEEDQVISEVKKILGGAGAAPTLAAAPAATPTPPAPPVSSTPPTPVVPPAPPSTPPTPVVTPPTPVVPPAPMGGPSTPPPAPATSAPAAPVSATPGPGPAPMPSSLPPQPHQPPTL